MQSELEEIEAKNKELSEEIGVYEVKMAEEEQRLDELTSSATELQD